MTMVRQMNIIDLAIVKLMPSQTAGFRINIGANRLSAPPLNFALIIFSFHLIKTIYIYCA